MMGPGTSEEWRELDEKVPEQSPSRRELTELLPVSLVVERRGGPLDGIGEREISSCDGLGGQGRRALLCARMCTAECIVGVWACICSR